MKANPAAGHDKKVEDKVINEWTFARPWTFQAPILWTVYKLVFYKLVFTFKNKSSLADKQEHIEFGNTCGYKFFLTTGGAGFFD